MTTAAIPTRPDMSGDPFVKRCASLGYSVWRIDPTGAIIASAVQPAAAALFESPGVRVRLQQAGAEMVEQASPQSNELFMGCWLVPVLERRGTRCLGGYFVAVVSARVLLSHEFQQACAVARVDPNAAGRELAKLVRPGMGTPDVAQIAAMLAWAREDLAQVGKHTRTLEEFSVKLLQSYEESNLLFRLARFMNCVTGADKVMQMVCHQLQQILPFEWIGIRFSATNTSVPELTGRTILVGRLPCAVATIEPEVDKVLARWSADDWTRLLDPGSSALAKLVGSEVVCDPITHDGNVIGVLLAGNKRGEGSESDVSSVETQIIDASADFLGVFHENLARFSEQQAQFMGTLSALTAAIDAKDPYTCGHSQRVSLLAVQMVEALGLSEPEIEHFRIAGLVHDVGKIGVPESVLCKPGRLNEEEFARIKLHPLIGHDILKDIPSLQPVLPGVLHHHERWDGGGYPHGLKGETIPLLARVLALADTFDAMSSNRAYRPAVSREHTLSEMRRCAGTQFDPALVPVFTALSFARFDALIAEHQAQANLAA